MPNKRGRAWHMERASVHKKGSTRPRSNKYTASYNDERPAVGSRRRVWVGGYNRADGTHVEGHYRKVD